MFAKVKPNTQIIGQNIIYFNQVDSTNQFASELIKQNLADNGTVILAEFQTKGRGQAGKTWLSEPFENLLFSIILKHVTNVPSDPFLVNKFITLAVYNFLQDYLPSAKVRIKWPNDLLVDGKKICGILVENNFSGQRLNYSIIGIGLNVNQNYEHFQHLNATSLSKCMGEPCQREDILARLLEFIEISYNDFLDRNKQRISRQFDQALLGYKELAQFEIEQGIKPAIIQGCDDDGRLILEHEGHIHPYAHGSIKQLIA